MRRLPVSVVMTVKNQPELARHTMRLLAAGTVVPREVIVAEAGDAAKLMGLLGTDPFPYRIEVVSLPGACRGLGRNRAIESSDTDWIIVTDAGCEPDPTWLEDLAEPLTSGAASVVAGGWRAATQDSDSVIPILCPSPSKAGYAASSRSLGFAKAAWRHVGGYPEGLVASEDTSFFRSLRRAIPPELVAYRPGSQTTWIWEGATPVHVGRRYFAYGVGDASARQRLALAAKMATAYGLLVGALLTRRRLVLRLFGVVPIAALWTRRWRSVRAPLAPSDRLRYFLLQGTADFAWLAGVCAGLLRRPKT